MLTLIGEIPFDAKVEFVRGLLPALVEHQKRVREAEKAASGETPNPSSEERKDDKTGSE